MEELRLLIEMISHLPAMALWVLVGFFAYKVIIIGSIYGVIRFVVGNLFLYLKTKKIEYVEVRPILEGECLTGSLDRLIVQIRKIKGRGYPSKGSEVTKPRYVWPSDVNWLADAIDEKIERESNVKAA